jgi:hypothetical protein
MVSTASRPQLTVKLTQGVFYGPDLRYLHLGRDIILCPMPERLSLVAKFGRKDFCDGRSQSPESAASVQLALRRLARAQIVTSANHRLSPHDGEGLQIGW